MKPPPPTDILVLSISVKYFVKKDFQCYKRELFNDSSGFYFLFKKFVAKSKRFLHFSRFRIKKEKNNFAINTSFWLYILHVHVYRNTKTVLNEINVKQ